MRAHYECPRLQRLRVVVAQRSELRRERLAGGLGEERPLEQADELDVLAGEGRLPVPAAVERPARGQRGDSRERHRQRARKSERAAAEAPLAPVACARALEPQLDPQLEPRASRGLQLQLPPPQLQASQVK